MSEAKRKNYEKNNYKNEQMKHRKLSFLEPGMKGFMATCNFREKDCIRECYNILNQYMDTSTNDPPPEDESTADKKSDDEEEEDISKALQKDLDKEKQRNQKKFHKFNVADTGVTNCVFIATSLDDPVGLGVKIARDIAATKVQRTKFLLRLIPVEVVCRANLRSITDAVGSLCDKYVLQEPKTFSVVFNRRYNNAISRDDVIKEVADVVTSKNSGNKVNLTEPEISIVVEIIKGMCCISVLPDYLKLKKYNLLELADVTNKGETKGGGGGGAAKETPVEAPEMPSEDTEAEGGAKEVQEATKDEDIEDEALPEATEKSSD